MLQAAQAIQSLPPRVRGLAKKVENGRLSAQDVERAGRLPKRVMDRYEFLRVLAGGNPDRLAGVSELARYSLKRDLAGETHPRGIKLKRANQRSRVR